MADDLRQKIQQAFNKVEQKMKDVPGYKGYKEKEVRREADKLLRMQVARGFDEQRRRLVSVQANLVSAGRLNAVLLLDRAAAKLQLLVDRLKTASYGYSGLFSAVKVREAELDALYAFDAALLDSVDKVKGCVEKVTAAPNDEELTKAGNCLIQVVDEANEAFGQRQDVLLKAAPVS
ncbi:MAG: hypothetical protein BWY10_00075 [Chloroflexi bacterium ADurb.Bin180]|nr:MAG: hypothetical protein BWY10_00075 [Chloroflexi bacterium ADurb.Bin180]HNR95684.1 hypothetical protein [Anaerolineae bacterium]HNT04655.1 hypothetical protein [Anaerolineae bacterium]HOU22908.1 hypothetical protein [Anaerolineae bacterium]HQJ50185.1 hypothetical protein [Anaerolineae bacterium]